MATSTTPDHDVRLCHEASENRRQLLCRLKCLAERLDDCDRAALKAAGCGDIFGSKGSRFVTPDPAQRPLITHPEYPERPKYNLNPPQKIPPWEPNSPKSQVIGGYVKNNCDCVRRNGMQDKCELLQCQGRPLCLTTPVPLCPPSGGAGLLVTPAEAAVIVDSIDNRRCCRLSCCSGLLENC
ncbi:uncharacterized protein LOC124356321 [Homalodisca vitripennis]|uniref:uncharacterized protein LOC124356321 n=1 Tax=Homalodisca vitripennis TaxID=197043 RepID=UPI001EEB5DBE|nr:uncharacterized protein LOC124356321 [Homalodisca vitripennis]KAG8257038.1 hypothetical protein J6590_057107 [Homalodisca vitripennis]